jgi:hypothetical protein
MHVYLCFERLRSSMDRMTDSGSVGWRFESSRGHHEVEKAFSSTFGEAFSLHGDAELKSRGDLNFRIVFSLSKAFSSTFGEAFSLHGDAELKLRGDLNFRIVFSLSKAFSSKFGEAFSLHGDFISQ